MQAKTNDQNFLSAIWQPVAKVNSVLSPSDRGYAASWLTWGAGYLMANHGAGEIASAMMLAGLAGAGLTKFLKKRFAERSVADQLSTMTPEVGLAYLEHLKAEKGGVIRRTCSSAWSLAKTGVIGFSAVYMTLNAPSASTISSSCMSLDQTTGEMVNRPC